MGTTLSKSVWTIVSSCSRHEQACGAWSGSTICSTMTKLCCTWCLKHINGGVALQMVLLLQPPHGARICELLLANAQDGRHVVLEVHLQFILLLICPKCIYGWQIINNSAPLSQIRFRWKIQLLRHQSNCYLRNEIFPNRIRTARISLQMSQTPEEWII